MEEYSKLIEYFGSFTDLSDAYIEELKENASTQHIKKDVIYFDKNSYSKKIGFLSKGIMRIYDIDAAGQEWNKVFILSPSLILGNPNIEQKSIHYIETITPCEVIELPIAFLKVALQKYTEAKEIQTKVLLQLFEKKSEREYDFLTLTAKERYVKFLKTHGSIVDQLPQFHIASYLGITPTQLSRINVSIRNQQM